MGRAVAELDRKLAAIAADQRMLITLEDVRRAGGDQHHAQRRLDGGRWTRVHTGVYLLAGAPMNWETRELAAILHAGPEATASHLAAARIWGLPGFARAGVELSVPRGRRYQQDGVRTHESTDLDRCGIVRRSGIPVTDPARTMLDLGRYVGIARLERAIEAGRREDLVDWTSLISTLTRHARKGRHGTRRLRSVILANAHRSEITDADLELLVLGLLRDAGLPEPVLHHRVLDAGRFVAEVDLAYPQWHIAIECDGDVHLLDDVRQRDLPRQNDLVLVGWTVLRFTYDRVRLRPSSVVSEVRAAIERARH